MTRPCEHLRNERALLEQAGMVLGHGASREVWQAQTQGSGQLNFVTSPLQMVNRSAFIVFAPQIAALAITAAHPSSYLYSSKTPWSWMLALVMTIAVMQYLKIDSEKMVGCLVHFVHVSQHQVMLMLCVPSPCDSFSNNAQTNSSSSSVNEPAAARPRKRR